MSGDGQKEQADKKVIHLDVDEHLPAVQNSSPAAEVVKQIIEQILANERRRARTEFIRIFVIFLVFLFVILGAGVWFARQLLAQLREERRLTEQSWRMMAGEVDGARPAYAAAKPRFPAAHSAPPAGARDYDPLPNRAMAAGLERPVAGLPTKGIQDSSASIRDMLQNQQDTIQTLNARLDEARQKIADAEPDGKAVPEKTRPVDFIAAPAADNLNLRMPIPSL